MSNQTNDNHDYFASPDDYPLPDPNAALSSVERESPSPLRERARRRERQRKSGSDWAWVIIAGVMLLVVVLISLVVVLLLRATQVSASANSQIAAVQQVSTILPTPVDARQDFSGDSAANAANTRQQNPTSLSIDQLTLDDGSRIALTPWDGDSRLTLLVMGLDRRPFEDGLAYRTDTIMLMSLDPATDSLGILSIPRDLYVDVPGYGELQRVNSALVLGELLRPDYGPTLAMQTIELNFGIRVHEYLLADFQAFITLVDAIGGIEIDVPYDIYDYQYPDMNYGFDPFVIRRGVQRLDGATALKFARTRNTDNDFERARRQQMVLFGLRDQILRPETFPQIVIQSPNLLASMSRNVYTSLSLDEMLQLALYLQDISVENIHTGVVDSNYSAGYRTQGGAAVLIPQRQALGYLMTDVFGAGYSQ